MGDQAKRDGDARDTGQGPKRLESHTRVRSQRVPTYATVLEELGDEQLNLTVNLVCVDHIVDGVPRDPSSLAAAATMRGRLDDLSELRGALNDLYLLATDPRMHEMVGPDAPLTEYLRGVYTWCKALLRALEESAYALRSLSVDWALLRMRIEDAAPFYMPELEGDIVAGAAQLLFLHPETKKAEDPLALLDERLQALFVSAATLSQRLEERFG
jgi:hypothetical protein